jgi:hypothetical protein
MIAHMEAQWVIEWYKPSTTGGCIDQPMLYGGYFIGIKWGYFMNIYIYLYIIFYYIYMILGNTEHTA